MEAREEADCGANLVNRSSGLNGAFIDVVPRSALLTFPLNPGSFESKCPFQTLITNVCGMTGLGQVSPWRAPRARVRLLAVIGPEASS